MSSKNWRQRLGKGLTPTQRRKENFHREKGDQKGLTKEGEKKAGEVRNSGEWM